MLSELYLDYEAFPGGLLEHGALAAAAGDVNDDGLTDLLLGGADGKLRLALNDAFRHPLRQPEEHPTPFQKTLQETRAVTVRSRGTVGVNGSGVRLAAHDGRVVARRRTGARVLTGCCGPDAVSLAVREPD